MRLQSWYDLIKDPDFAIQHLPHSKRVNQHCLLQKEGILNGHVSLLCLDEITQHVSRHRLNLSSVSYDLRSVDSYEILGPCDGIYCFISLPNVFEQNPIALANVSLREFKVVPDLSISHPHRQRQCVKQYGFGFDRKTNDYKVVLILSYEDIELWIQLEQKEVVYSLRSNSWRELDHTFPIDPISYWSYSLTSGNGTYVNGNCHWLVTHMFAIGDLRCAILYFDMADEVFRLIYLPKLCDIYINFKVLLLYNDSLSLVVRPKSYIPDKTCEVWILQDYDDDEPWTKLVTIGPIEGITRSLRMLGFWRNGEFLFDCDQEQVISYNPNTQKITQKFRVCGPLQAYSESLISIIGDQRDDQNMLFDIVKETDYPTLQQTTSSGSLHKDHSLTKKVEVIEGGDAMEE